MRDLILRATLAGVALAGCSALGQMHKVAKPEHVVRAIGVYEWTGDLAKPTASRLIPVTIFIEGKLEDAAVYVARPVPFALLSGNVYELQDAGIDKGLLDLAFARRLQSEDATGATAYDDGWFGYGTVKPLAAPRRPVALKPSKTLPVITGSNDANRPHFGTKPPADTTASTPSDQSKAPAASTATDTTTASTNDSDRPTMKRRSSTDGDAGTTTSTPPTASGASTADTTPAKGTTSTAADDPDRPTMKRRSQDSPTANPTDGTTTTTASATPPPSDDPDRPTMKRRSPTDTGTTSDAPASSGNTTASTPADDPDRPTMKHRPSDGTPDNTTDTTTASTTGTGSTPANDPDRPTLKRHSAEDAKRAKNNGSDLASVTGAAGSLNDDPNRPNLHHGKPTSAMTETELPKLLGLPPELHQMVAVSDAVNRDPHEFALAFDDDADRAAVLEKLQAMARTQLAAYEKPPAPASSAVKKPTPATTRPHRTTKPVATPPEPLVDEQLKAYTLSYGGASTYIYTAHTAGTGAALRYVTVVAQADGLGDLKPAIQSVTDAAHLDRTPRMRFVDVVDVEASNRASLLFELRGQNSRQFGLYRVIAAHSEQIFLTGTTQ